MELNSGIDNGMRLPRCIGIAVAVRFLLRSSGGVQIITRGAARLRAGGCGGRGEHQISVLCVTSPLAERVHTAYGPGRLT